MIFECSLIFLLSKEALSIVLILEVKDDTVSTSGFGKKLQRQVFSPFKPRFQLAKINKKPRVSG